MAAAQRLDFEDAAQAGIVEDGFRRSLGDQLAVIEQGKPVAEAGGEGEVVQHDDDAGAATGRPAQQLHHFELVQRVDTPSERTAWPLRREWRGEPVERRRITA